MLGIILGTSDTALTQNRQGPAGGSWHSSEVRQTKETSEDEKDKAETWRQGGLVRWVRRSSLSRCEQRPEVSTRWAKGRGWPCLLAGHGGCWRGQGRGRHEDDSGNSLLAVSSFSVKPWTRVVGEAEGSPAPSSSCIAAVWECPNAQAGQTGRACQPRATEA